MPTSSQPEPLLPCFYHPAYYLPLPAGHAFPMAKFPEAYAMLAEENRRDGLNLDFRVTQPVPEPAMLRVHRESYLDKILHHGLSQYERNRVGLPPHDRLLLRSRYGAGGTYQAALACLDGAGIACNLAGGTHHAFSDRGHGFCVLNDVAIAIRELQQRDPERFVMVIDTDAHQGNGTHFLFREDPHVFCYSIHVGRNFPARKEPGDLDVPLPRWVTETAYLDALDQTLEPAFLQFEPDLVFWISGADVHEDDRFGQMRLTTSGVRTRDTMVMELVSRWRVPTVVVYGGGYNRNRHMTARIHANTIRTAARFLERYR